MIRARLIPAPIIEMISFERDIADSEYNSDNNRVIGRHITTTCGICDA